MEIEFTNAIVIGAGMAVGQILVEFVRALFRVVSKTQKED